MYFQTHELGMKASVNIAFRHEGVVKEDVRDARHDVARRTLHVALVVAASVRFAQDRKEWAQQRSMLTNEYIASQCVRMVGWLDREQHCGAVPVWDRALVQHELERFGG